MSKKKSTEDGEAKEHKRPWQETIATSIATALATISCAWASMP